MGAEPENGPSEELKSPIALPAEKARGGEIILRTRLMPIIFIAGLAGFIALALLLLLLGGRAY